jgi:GNAT superfamily N-acetyltransferase
MAELLIQEIPLGDARLRDFVEVPWQLYRGDPCWTPPLRADYLGSKLMGLVGLLTPEHPYHQHAEVTHFLATQDSKLVGRISGAINRRFNDYHRTEIGFFGFFETVEDFDVARALLDAARDWVKERGLKVLRGPGEYSNATHERQGVLISGFEHPPTVELTHNPPFYGEFLERYGFHKAMDWFAYMGDEARPEDTSRLARIAEHARKRYDITTRMVDLKSLDEEIELLVRIYNESWAQNWGFLPLTDEETHALADSLRNVLVSDLLHFAFVRGEPASVVGALPDLYIALRPRWRWPLDVDLIRGVRALLRGRHVHRLRGMFFGVRPAFRRMGIDAVLFNELVTSGLRLGYSEIEASMMLEENNDVLRLVEAFGLRQYKTWRIYDMEL